MLGLIGGTGLNRLEGLVIDEQRKLSTQYGSPSGAVHLGQRDGQKIAFLPRHGHGHRIPPHAINYRANLFALKLVGVTHIIGVAAVGGIGAHMAPGELVLPDDIIDYTWGRQHTYSMGAQDPLRHIEFAPPYDAGLREALQHSANRQNIKMMPSAVHGVTQGPRLETAAEVRRMGRDGCDIVGMTGMPEAALARELDIPYACLAVVVNWAAGVGAGDSIHAEIEKFVDIGMDKALRVIQGLQLS